MNPTVNEKALLVYKRSNKRMHVINYSEYVRKQEKALNDPLLAKELNKWRLATDAEIIEFQKKRGRNMDIKAPEIKVKAAPKSKDPVKEQPKEKVILRSDPIQEIKPEKKEIKKDEFEINS